MEGTSDLERFRAGGRVTDMDAVIGKLRLAAELACVGHPDKPYHLSNLREPHMMRFGYLGEMANIEPAIKYQVNLANDD